MLNKAEEKQCRDNLRPNFIDFEDFYKGIFKWCDHSRDLMK